MNLPTKLSKLSILSLARAELERLRSSSLAHNAGWMLIGQGMNLVLQASYFILLARLLGVREYGIFAGAFAFVSIATPYSALGSGLLFIQYVSTNAENFAAYWGNVLLSIFSAGTLIAGLLYLIAPHLLNPASASVVLLVALGECICRPLASCIAQMFQAFEQLRITAAVNLLTSLLRLLAVAALALLVRHATAWQWALASLVVSVLAALAGSAIVTTRFGCPRFVPRLLLARLGAGLNFSLAGSTQTVYNDIDKTMLSHYGMNVANGIYTMAYRFVDLATIPITALDAAALPRYFRQSAQGAASVVGLSRRLAKRAALLGIAMSACMFIAAPLVPHIVGRGFSQSVVALRWLCLIPAFRGVHQLTGSAITGMGFQRYRTRAQLGAAAFNLGLNLWLIPRYSWLGAAWASLATDGGLAMINSFLLRNLNRLQHLDHNLPSTPQNAPRAVSLLHKTPIALSTLPGDANESPTRNEAAQAKRTNATAFNNSLDRGTANPYDGRKVSGVIVSYHPTSDLVVNVKILLRQIGYIVVVDNTPGPLISEVLSELQTLDRCHVILNGKNLGVASALNIGIVRSLAEGFLWIATFDQDSQITEGYIPNMFMAYQKECAKYKTGIVFPRYKDARLGIFLPSRTSPDGFAVSCITSGALISADVIREIGLMEEPLFIDYVDIEYSLRIRAAGYKIKLSSDSVLLHSLGHIAPRKFFGKYCLPTNHMPQRHYYITRNRLILIRRYWIKDTRWACIDLLGIFKSILKIALYESQKALKLKYIALGARDALLLRVGERVLLSQQSSH